MKYGDYDSHKDYFKMALITSAIIGLIVLGFWLERAHAQTLTASWYSVASLKKEGTWKNGETKMANGKRFDETAYTCATRLYPLGTVLVVRNISNGNAVRVVCTDRISKKYGSTRIDLSKKSFEILTNGNLKLGLVKVEVTKL